MRGSNQSRVVGLADALERCLGLSSLNFEMQEAKYSMQAAQAAQAVPISSLIFFVVQVVRTAYPKARRRWNLDGVAGLKASHST